MKHRVQIINSKMLSVLFGLSFILATEHWIGWEKVLQPWKQLQLSSLLIAVLLMFLTYQIRALRIYDYFRGDLKGQWWSTMRLSLLHNALNNLLPMRSGEASFPILMQRYFGINLHRSLPALLWFRLLDLHTLVTITVVVVLSAKLPLEICVVAALLCMSLPYCAYLFRAELILRLEDSEGIKSKLYILLLGLPESNFQFIKSWALTCLNWMLKLLVLAWVLGEFLPTKPSILLSSVVAGEITSVLPFHAPGGIGTYEAGAAAPLLMTDNKAAVMPAVINLHLFILSGSMIGGMMAWLFPLTTTPSEEV